MKKSFLMFLSIGLLVAGCGSYQGDHSGYETKTGSKKTDSKIVVKAYLFDAKLKQAKKPTSFRLNMYETEEMISFGARGYLGKGAMKGILTADSLLVLFPTIKEYMNESNASLLSSFDCQGDLPPIDILRLFKETPEFLNDYIDATVLKVNDNKKRPRYEIKFNNCLWKIVITYDSDDDGWHIRRFVFSDGKDKSLTAKRREFHGNSKVKKSRFNITADSSFVRITP